MKMTKSERVQAALQGEKLDRPPISLWKHYHLRDQAPGHLAKITVDLHQRFDTDLVKLMPSGLYAVQDWGTAIRFGRDDATKPRIVEPAVSSPEEWPELPKLDPYKGALRKQLEMISQVDDRLNEVPFMMTVFSPLTVAYKLRGGQFEGRNFSGEKLLDDLRKNPEKLHEGLETIKEVVVDFMDACLEAGASGFFYATQLANKNDLSRKEYEEFGEKYDRPILEEFYGESEVTMLHACRHNIMIDLVSDYPVDVINWYDRKRNPGLAEAKEKTDKALAGGLSLDTLLNGTEEEVKAEVHDAIEGVGKEKLIIAPGCVIKPGTDDSNLKAARRAVSSA